MWQEDITSNAQPSAASPAGAVAQINAQGAAVSGLLKAANTGYEMKKAYDISKGVEEGRAARNLFFESNMEAEVAAADLASNAAQQRSLMEQNKFLSHWESSNPEETSSLVEDSAVNLAVLDGLRSEASRLKAAVNAGMSNEEYALRVSAITKATIAKYPGLGDRIREAVGQVTGLPGADEFASYQFVRSRFSGRDGSGDKGSAPSPEDIIKDVATNGGYVLKDVADAYSKDPMMFEQMASVARDMLATKRDKTALESRLASTTIVSDQQARAQIPTLQALVQAKGSELHLDLVKSGQYGKLDELLKAAGTDTFAKESVLKQHAATVKSRIARDRQAVYAEINKMQAASGGTISDKALAEMRAEVDRAYGMQEELLADPSGNGTLAILGVVNGHKDKTFQQQVALAGVYKNFLDGWANNMYVQMFIAHGAERERVKTLAPELYARMSELEARTLDTMGNINNLMDNGKLIGDMSSAAKATETTIGGTPRTRTADAVVAAVARDKLTRYMQEKTGKAPDNPTVNAISNLMLRSFDRAAYNQVAEDLPELRKFWEEVPPDMKGEATRQFNNAYITSVGTLKKTFDDFKKKNKGFTYQVLPGTTSLVAVRNKPLGEKKGMGFNEAFDEVGRKDEAEKHVRRNVVPNALASARVRHVVTGESLDVAFKKVVEQLSTGAEPLVKMESVDTAGSKLSNALATGAKLPDGQSMESTPEEKDVVNILKRELAAEKAALSIVTSMDAKERITENIRAIEAELANYKGK